MRIIHTVGSIGEWAGGPSRTITSLCSTMATLGYEVHLVSGHDVAHDGKLVEPSRDLVQLHLIDSRRMLGIRFSPGFSKKIIGLAGTKKQSSSLIHDHGIWGLTNIAAAKAAHHADIPYVLSPRGMLEPWAFKYKGRKKKLAWMLYQKRIVTSSATLIATSEQELDNTKTMFPRLPVALIPNGVSLPKGVPDRSASSIPGRANLLFMSRIHPVKNVLGLVRAWTEVCRTPSRAHWILQIAGPDELDHTREVKTLVSSLGMESRVEFLGPVGEGEKGALLEAADLFVLPSFTENFGVVVAEALASGLPVIATRGTPWRSLVERRCGWWPDASPSTLALALAEAIDLSAAERHVMGLRGREYAKSAFTWDRVGMETTQLYEWVVGHEPIVPSFVYV